MTGMTVYGTYSLRYCMGKSLPTGDTSRTWTHGEHEEQTHVD